MTATTYLATSVEAARIASAEAQSDTSSQDREAALDAAWNYCPHKLTVRHITGQKFVAVIESPHDPNFHDRFVLPVKKYDFGHVFEVGVWSATCLFIRSDMPAVRLKEEIELGFLPF